MRRFEYVSRIVSKTFPLPCRKTKQSAGYDFVTPVDVTVPAGSISDIIPTGVKCCMEQNEYLALYIRSSIACKQGLTLVNAVGVIDADYYNNVDNEGEISFMLQNLTKNDVTIPAGTRIMQGIFTPFALTEDDSASGERVGGIGSTGSTVEAG